MLHLHIIKIAMCQMYMGISYIQLFCKICTYACAITQYSEKEGTLACTIAKFSATNINLCQLKLDSTQYCKRLLNAKITEYVQYVISIIGSRILERIHILTNILNGYIMLQSLILILYTHNKVQTPMHLMIDKCLMTN